MTEIYLILGYAINNVNLKRLWILSQICFRAIHNCDYQWLYHNISVSLQFQSQPESLMDACPLFLSEIQLSRHKKHLIALLDCLSVMVISSSVKLSIHRCILQQKLSHTFYSWSKLRQRIGPFLRCSLERKPWRQNKSSHC